jgi:hypothetical protein
MKFIKTLLLIFFVLLGIGLLLGNHNSDILKAELMNPYDEVDWQTFAHHKADLHAHTLQSDGFYSVDEVVRAHHDAGFSILSITDHDHMTPNRHVRRGNVPAEKATHYPDPKPENFPANTTWPWTDYGSQEPEELGMVGIEGNEVSTLHHINSFFNDYGVADRSDAPDEDVQLEEIGKRGGLAFLDHPGVQASWWTRLPPDCYTERYRKHSADYLAGLEISGGGYYDYNMSLWDQLLAEFMPDRPVWGFSTTDMHELEEVRFGFTVFLLDELTEDNVKEAMKSGQFYSVRGPETINLLEEKRGHVYDGAYPELKSIDVDQDREEIVIEATGYDEIVWISNPTSNEELNDYRKADRPWALGEVVHRGKSFDYSGNYKDRSYVRAEIIRHTDEGPIRVFTNPFGLTYH